MNKKRSNREPLVAGRIEAWDGGPVMRIIWNHLRDFGLNAVGSLMGDTRDASPYTPDLTASERQVLKHVWFKYGPYSGLDLSIMTHQPGPPWSKAYSALSQAEIRQHFIELALAGRSETA